MDAGVPTGVSLVEREGEIRALDGLVRAAAAGRGGLVSVEGSPGIGKSALLAFARERAEASDVRVLYARGTELGRDVPFGVARRLLNGVLRAVPEALDVGLAPLARPVFHGGLGVADEGVAQPVVQALITLVANVVDAGESLLLCVDDVQWADRASLLFLADLAARLDEVPVGLAVTVRAGEAATDEGLVARLQATPGAVILTPEPLSADG